jgi:hypothetical protein
MSVKNWRGLESWRLDPISIEPKLDNYLIWSFKVEVILKSRGLWHLVDGTEVAPTEGNARCLRTAAVLGQHPGQMSLGKPRRR